MLAYFRHDGQTWVGLIIAADEREIVFGGFEPSEFGMPAFPMAGCAFVGVGARLRVANRRDIILGYIP
jgi:hypothetical protein